LRKALWFGSIGLVAAMALAAAVVALPGPPPLVVTFSRTIATGNNLTVNVTGSITLDPANRSVNGTISISVTNATGAVIASHVVSFSATANATGLANQDVFVSEAMIVIHLAVDPVAQTVAVTWDPISERPDRRGR
jgi:hypothetical protein